MRLFLITCFLLLAATGAAPASDWPDATPTAWHQLARAESLLSAPEPPNPVAVCIVDSGVNLTPDLAPVVIERLAYDGGDPGDTYPQEGIDDGHGTYVATFLAGQVNGWGGAGLWPRAKIVSVRVFPPGGKRAKAADYLRGLHTCAQRRPAVINLSLNDVDASPEEFAEMADRITRYRRDEDINVVVAAGNRGGPVEPPATFPSAFTVGAVDAAGALCPFSARGDRIDVVAPGCGLEAYDQQGRAARFDGTSFAAPMVAAALAAIRAYEGISAAAAEHRLIASGRSAIGGLVIDMDAALRRTQGNSSWQAPSPIDEHPTSLSGASTKQFVDYPRPRLRLNIRENRRVHIKVLNKPRLAQLEWRSHQRLTEGHAEQQTILVRKKQLVQFSIRFISDEGASPWRRVRLPDSRRR